MGGRVLPDTGAGEGAQLGDDLSKSQKSLQDKLKFKHKKTLVTPKNRDRNAANECCTVP